MLAITYQYLLLICHFTENYHGNPLSLLFSRSLFLCANEWLFHVSHSKQNVAGHEIFITALGPGMHWFINFHVNSERQMPCYLQHEITILFFKGKAKSAAAIILLCELLFWGIFVASPIVFQFEREIALVIFCFSWRSTNLYSILYKRKVLI